VNAGKRAFSLNHLLVLGLDLFDQVSQANGRMQAGEQVKMVLRAVDAVKMAAPVFQDAPDVSEETLALGRHQRRHAVFRRKDDVVVNLGVGGHGLGSTWCDPFGVGRYLVCLFRGLPPTATDVGSLRERAVGLRISGFPGPSAFGL